MPTALPWGRRTTKGVHDRALLALDRAIGLRPQAAPLYFNRGVVLARAGRREEAAGAFQQALPAGPELRSGTPGSSGPGPGGAGWGTGHPARSCAGTGGSSRGPPAPCGARSYRAAATSRHGYPPPRSTPAQPPSAPPSSPTSAAPAGDLLGDFMVGSSPASPPPAGTPAPPAGGWPAPPPQAAGTTAVDFASYWPHSPVPPGRERLLGAAAGSPGSPGAGAAGTVQCPRCGRAGRRRG